MTEQLLNHLHLSSSRRGPPISRTRKLENRKLGRRRSISTVDAFLTGRGGTTLQGLFITPRELFFQARGFDGFSPGPEKFDSGGDDLAIRSDQLRRSERNAVFCQAFYFRYQRFFRPRVHVGIKGDTGGLKSVFPGGKVFLRGLIKGALIPGNIFGVKGETLSMLQLQRGDHTCPLHRNDSRKNSDKVVEEKPSPMAARGSLDGG